MLVDCSRINVSPIQTCSDSMFGMHTAKRLFRSDEDIRKNIEATIGQLHPNEDIHFYSLGNFNLVKLILYIIGHIGPSHLLMCSYSFSKHSIEQLQHNIENGSIMSFKLLIDNRVKTMSPKPFDMIMRMFDYKCTSLHAKVALIWNDKWHMSIVTSQNATDNPKLERGTIFTSKNVFDFDYKILSNEFNRATT
jgi:hypothetical protein